MTYKERATDDANTEALGRPALRVELPPPPGLLSPLERQVGSDLGLLKILLTDNHSTDTVARRVLLDFSRFFGLTSPKREELAERLSARVDELAEENFYLYDFILVDLERDAKKQKERRTSFENAQEGANGKAIIARTTITETLKLLQQRLDKLHGDYDILAVDAEVEHLLRGEEERIFLSAPRGTMDRLGTIGVLKFKVEEARIAAFPRYAKMFDRMLGGTGEIALTLVQEFNDLSHKEKIKKAKWLEKRIDERLNKAAARAAKILPDMLPEFFEGKELTEIQTMCTMHLRGGPRTQRMALLETLGEMEPENADSNKTA